MKRISMIIPAATVALAAAAAIPAGYYDSLYGKTGTRLKQAVKSAIADHKVISYGDHTWEAFLTTDTRTVAGKEIWYDMYSNVMEPVANGHNGLNIEHSVPNSWWGGKSGSVEAYSDLHLLNPSNSDANNRKSNWPMGPVDQLTWTNGLSLLGVPVIGFGGGSATVFEPADEYKGDFARAYFYVFTIYDDIPWQDSPAYMYDSNSALTLRPWAYDMLLQWAADDPVDAREVARNEAIYGIQGNRNPFIDMPRLMDFIWGAGNGAPFEASDAVQTIINRPESPVFTGMEMPALNTYSGRWWDTMTLSIEGTGDIWYTLDGGPEMKYEGGIEIAAASQEGITRTITARTRAAADGLTLSSPEATLTLLARNPANEDLKDASWRLVTSSADLSESGQYILVSVKNHGVMNTSVSKSSSSWSLGSDWKAEPQDDTITGVMENTAVLTLEPASVSTSGDTWYIGVSDIAGNSLGYLSSTTAKKMQIAPDGSETTITVDPDGTATISFGSGVGNIFYNASQPRFSTYTSTTLERVSLYALADGGNSAVTAPGADGTPRVENGQLTAPEGTVVYDLRGVRVDASRPLRGLYIVVTPKGASKILF
ncbi:MAG: endonuclease [Muribaculaceae bacterium]|nr:endonuclease [Muribaculaceae bacterium]